MELLVEDYKDFAKFDNIKFSVSCRNKPTVLPVRDFLKLSALEVGFDPVFEGEGENELCIDNSTGMKIAKVSKLYFRPFDTLPLAGNPLKIESDLGWKRTVNFEQLISIMVKADIDRRNKGVLDI